MLDRGGRNSSGPGGARLRDLLPLPGGGAGRPRRLPGGATGTSVLRPRSAAGPTGRPAAGFYLARLERTRPEGANPLDGARGGALESALPSGASALRAARREGDVALRDFLVGIRDRIVQRPQIGKEKLDAAFARRELDRRLAGPRRAVLLPGTPGSGGCAGRFPGPPRGGRLARCSRCSRFGIR